MKILSIKALREKIASNEYGAELCLQQAMENIARLESKLEGSVDSACDIPLSQKTLLRLECTKAAVKFSKDSNFLAISQLIYDWVIDYE